MAGVKHLGYTAVDPRSPLAIGKLFPKPHLKLYPYFKATVPFPGKIKLEPISKGTVEDEAFCYWDRYGFLHIPAAILDVSILADSFADIYWNTDDYSIDLIRTSMSCKQQNMKAAERQHYIWCYDIE